MALILPVGYSGGIMNFGANNPGGKGYLFEFTLGQDKRPRSRFDLSNLAGHNISMQVDGGETKLGGITDLESTALDHDVEPVDDKADPALNPMEPTCETMLNLATPLNLTNSPSRSTATRTSTRATLRWGSVQPMAKRRPHRWSSGGVVLVAHLALVAGCESALSPSVGCFVDEECADGELCIAGLCIAPDDGEAPGRDDGGSDTSGPTAKVPGEEAGEVLPAPDGCVNFSANGSPYVSCTARPFAAASSICALAGGKVARFDDEPGGLEAGRAEEAALLIALLPLGVEEFWLALTDLALEGTFVWESAGRIVTAQGSPENHFAAGQPDDRFAEDCTENHTAENLWNDITCEDVNQLVCESASPFQGGPADCSPATIDGRSYLFCTSFRQGIAAGAQVCQDGGGALLNLADGASVDANERERNLINDEARARGVSFHWLDLNDIQREGIFMWGNGVVLDRRSDAPENHFAAGEPNDVGGEDCVVATRVGWHDQACGDNFHVICELPRE